MWEIGYIPGYILERSDRDRKGGLACYVRSDLSYNVRDRLSDEIENIFVDKMLPKITPISVRVVYRPLINQIFSNNSLKPSLVRLILITRRYIL